MSWSGLGLGFGLELEHGLGLGCGRAVPTALAAAAAAAVAACWLPSASPPAPSVEPCSPPAVTSPSFVAQKWIPS